MSIKTTERIKVLDIHITHNCNLTCESCSDFTNSGLNWMISKEEFEVWIKNWNKRVNPSMFNILGGEPTLHKNLEEFLYLARELWGPNQNISLITNGFFVHLHPNLNKVLKETNIDLCVSIHTKDKEYVNKLKKNILLMKEWKREGVSVYFADHFSNWRKIYKGYGESILPYEDNDPQSSWENCFADELKCFQLYEGKLWKCAPITYLKDISKKYKISDKWDPYLKYVPMSPDCSDEELEKFWNSECMDICSMCPANKIEIKVTKNPLMSVSQSEKYYQ
jgi:organic radical activating enzyme